MSPHMFTSRRTRWVAGDFGDIVPAFLGFVKRKILHVVIYSRIYRIFCVMLAWATLTASVKQLQEIPCSLEDRKKGKTEAGEKFFRHILGLVRGEILLASPDEACAEGEQSQARQA